MDDNQNGTPKKATNPRRIAVLGMVATIFAIINMSTGREAASHAVVILQYAALAGGVTALVGGLIMMAASQK